MSSLFITRLNTNFIEWFVGFSEAESKFIIRIRKNSKGIVRGFEFLFRITLHKDDLNTFVLIISKFEDLKSKILPIFDMFNLKGVKHLNYLAFKEGFLLYINRSDINSILINKILYLKNSMNDKRVDFDLCFNDKINKDHVNITENYILG